MRRLFELMIVVVMLAAGCSLSGLQISPHHDFGSLLGDSGHHTLNYEHLIMDYDYSIDRNRNTITFDGTISFRNIHEGFKVEALNLQVGLLDFNRVIIDTQDFFLSNLNTREKNPFKKTFPYKSEYKLIAFFYSFQY